MEERKHYVRLKKVFGLDETLPQLTKSHQNLDVGKLGVVIESFKMVLDSFKTVLQLDKIQFYLHASLMYCCQFL